VIDRDVPHQSIGTTLDSIGGTHVMTNRWLAVPIAAIVLIACTTQLSVDLGGLATPDGGAAASGAPRGKGAGAAAATGGQGVDASVSSAPVQVGPSGAGTLTSAAPTSSSTMVPSSADGADGGEAGGPASDLLAPATGAGLQFATTEGAYVVPSGQELFATMCVTLSNDIQVGRFEGWMSSVAGAGGHDFLVDVAATPDGGTCTPSNGTQTTTTAGEPLFIDRSPAQIVEMSMPAGVALPLAAGTQLALIMHFINPGQSAVYPTVKLNLLFAQNVRYEAGVMVALNATAFVLPGTAASPATQTVTGSCSPPEGSNFFFFAAYGSAQVAALSLVSGGKSTEIVHSGPLAAGQSYPADQQTGTGVATNARDPAFAEFSAPNFLTVNQGEMFTYECSYSNASPTPLVVAGGAYPSCVAVGLYFPAGMATCH
jgi:hypothetical protein